MEEFEQAFSDVFPRDSEFYKKILELLSGNSTGSDGRSLLPATMPMKRESPMLSVHDVVTDDVLDGAYRWLCERRKRYPDAADIWTFRQRWPRERERTRQELIAGTKVADLRAYALRWGRCHGGRVTAIVGA